MVIEKKINSASVSMKSLHPLDHALELLHFGFRGLTVKADQFLATLDLSRVHHRVLYIIARADEINVGDLAMTLGISKQALHRPLKHLIDQDLVCFSRAPERHRFKLLALTEAGRVVEQTATESERQTLDQAFRSAGVEGQAAWTSIMASLADNLN
ncbi:transcriptional regulator [Pseudomonas prosekii]|jgi:DNA-binding MarR family transcriptional regulator|uniref:Transcriptional regulator n=2 Tax=Pseudomonas TaxID=286 RepID=A0A3L8CUH5_9PSED|nr:MarR family transcriptional regulator [Pseudomonas prosekii]RLU08142.1 transcriptional regulator [Pseudomonas prosekii]RLU11610.1 transcriptional regulator [Pseudomonas prosekii]TWD50303.1 MarR family transcriptional regulator [Pseudomonas sp. SJZ131]